MIAYDPQALAEFSASWRLVRKEAALLVRTSDRLFAEDIDLQWVLALAQDDERSERVEAFAALHSRLQDTLGDRLFPRLLALVGQEGRTLIDRLNQVERLGLLDDAQAWLAWRNLRNRLVHEYVENPGDFVDAMRAGHENASALRTVVARIEAWLRHRGIDEKVLS